MAGSVLTYRVYRLRRLIVVCLGIVAFGIVIGLWLVPGSSALQVVCGLGLFSIFSMAQLAMILLWPRDTAGPLTYAAGLVPALAVGFPAGAVLMDNPETSAAFMTVLVVFGPLVWLIGVPLLGWVILKPLDLLIRRNITLHMTRLLPMPVADARKAFFAAPGKQRLNAVTGPVEWDGFFAETVTRRVAGPASGQISTQQVVIRMRILQEDALSQGVMVQVQPEAGQTSEIAVLHQTLTAQGDATRIDRQFHIERGAWSALLTGWLGDLQQDSLTALQDEALGQPSFAISAEPDDTMGNSLQRWLRWNEAQPGG